MYWLPHNEVTCTSCLTRVMRQQTEQHITCMCSSETIVDKPVDGMMLHANPAFSVFVCSRMSRSVPDSQLQHHQPCCIQSSL